jgi:hypothetical protein
MRAKPLLASVASAVALGLAQSDASTIIFVSNSATADTGYVSWLENQGYQVDFRLSAGTSGLGELDAGEIAALNAADLIIFSRNTSSGDFAGAGEPTIWNNITTPLLLHSPYLVRTAQWQWFDTTAGPVSRDLLAVTPTSTGLVHPIFNGASGALFATETGVGLTPVTTAGNGTVLATASPDNYVAVAEWQPGVPFHGATTETPGDLRVFFPLGAQAGSDLDYFGTLSADGQEILANTIAYMIPEPSSAALLVVAGLGLACRRRRV